MAGVSLQGPQLGAEFGKLLAWRSTAGGVVQLSYGPNGERVALAHDSCGRVVSRRIDRKGFRLKTWTYGWDALDRLVRCDNPEGETWFYRYDPFGRRLSKVRKSDEELAWTAQKHAALVPATTREATKIWIWPKPPSGAATVADAHAPAVGIQFLWDGDVVAEEAPLRLDGSASWTDATRWYFEQGSFRPLAKKASSNRLLAIVTDHLGTSKETFDEDGGLCWAASYTTWGLVRGVLSPTEPSNDARRAIYPRSASRLREPRSNDATKEDVRFDCPIRFQGQWEEADNDLVYNRFRYFDPRVSQYVSADPIGLAGGARSHAYTISPTCHTDPIALSQTTLYRAVSPAEAEDIGRTGQFRLLPGGPESKYFSTTEAGAKQYGEMAKRFGENQTIIVKTRIPTRLITPDMTTTVDRGISTVTVPGHLLPQLTPEIPK